MEFSFFGRSLICRWFYVVYVLRFRQENLDRNQFLVCAAVNVLECAANELRGSVCFVLAAVGRMVLRCSARPSKLGTRRTPFPLPCPRMNGCALKYAAPVMKGSEALVLAAVTTRGWEVRLASPELWEDSEVALATVPPFGAALEFVSPRLKTLAPWCAPRWPRRSGV